MNNICDEGGKLQVTAQELYEENMQKLQKKVDHQAQAHDTERKQIAAEQDRVRQPIGREQPRAQEAERLEAERHTEEETRQTQREVCLPGEYYFIPSRYSFPGIFF